MDLRPLGVSLPDSTSLAHTQPSGTTSGVQSSTAVNIPAVESDSNTAPVPIGGMLRSLAIQENTASGLTYSELHEQITRGRLSDAGSGRSASSGYINVHDMSEDRPRQPTLTAASRTESVHSKDAPFIFASSPDVVRVGANEFEQAKMRMLNNLDGWHTPYATAEGNDQPESESDFQQESPEKQTDVFRWNSRIQDTEFILSVGPDIEEEASDVEESFVHRVAGEPVGVMSVLPTDASVYVVTLVTHPGSQGSGGILIERAVALSVSQGSEGRVTLEALSGAVSAYTALGFKLDNEAEPENFMTLDPQRSALWVKNEDGNFVLAKYAQGCRTFAV